MIPFRNSLVASFPLSIHLFCNLITVEQQNMKLTEPKSSLWYFRVWEGER